MINRTMVRTRVLQTLFAYYKDGDCTPLQAKKNLINSFSYTYNLYALMLSLMDELSTYASNQLSESVNRARITHRNFVPNRRFADNTFAQQVFANRQLRHIMNAGHLSWEMGLDAMSALYRDLQGKDYYQSFMHTQAPTYEDERMLWRKIYTDLLPDHPALLTALEDMEIAMDQVNWETDLNIVISYIIKTIKRFEQDKGSDQPLLEMFDSEDELQFAEQLLLRAIEHKEEYDQMIEESLTNWKMDRLAYMDRIILQLAITEIYCFPDIAPQVSLNEYIELAKEYSSNKSYIFVNGILDEILKKGSR